MGSLADSAGFSSTHVVVFPFMSKGHTIPLLQLSHLLLRRGATVTIFTTPANRPFISSSVSGTTASIITLSFPTNIDGIPEGVENTDKLPSMSLFVPFATSTKLMKPQFENALATLQNVTFMITDAFLGWTLDSASKFGIPRLATYGFSGFSTAINRSVTMSRVLFDPNVVSDDELFQVPDFPWIKVTRNDFDSPFIDREPTGPFFEFVKEQVISTTNSHGLIVNSFYELEPKFIDYLNRECKPKAWSLGPLCLAEQSKSTSEKPPWVKWLDDKLENEGRSVLYVAFGSQVELSAEQLHEIKIGLEKSGVCFLWVVGKNGKYVETEFEGRVKDRGLVVREWVDQKEILKHESVKGFLSHCGWNSVLESLCAKVPILGWPMMAEQPLNVRMVVEEIKVGLRVETCDGTVRGFVKWEGLAKTVRELMEGEMGKAVRKKVEEIGDSAAKAMEEGGSSWRALNRLIEDIHAFRSKEFV